MKNIKLKLLIIVLMVFSCTFLFSINETKAIYREDESTTIRLTVASESDYVVNFVTNGGTSIPSRTVSPNTAVGVLPIPTKTDYNFAGWYDSNNQRVTHQTVITSDIELHAEWKKIVCKRVTDSTKLHTETCVSGGCVAGNNASGFHANDIITYGTVGDGVPISGDAYDCDVNDDGTFDATESDHKTYTERFYFVREKTNANSDNTAVLVYSTSFDEHGRDDRVTDKNDGSTHYNLAITYLPASTVTQTNSNAWDNPLLVDFDGNGKVSRFISMTDLESVCGQVTMHNGNSGTSYFANCQKWFWFENSRFQNANIGRAGIWMEYETGDTKYHRIHTQSFDVMEVEESSENMARPVIEIPMSALEGYYDEDRFTLSFNTYTGDTNVPESIKRYRGEAIGTLPTPTREGYTFENWYTDSEYQNVVDPTALVSGNMTLYANWEPLSAVHITLYLNDGEITGVSSPITINFGETLSDLPDPTRTGYNFGGWYTDSGLNNLFDKTQSITTDLDLYAKWDQTVTVTVTLYLDGGTITGVTSPITLNYGSLLNNLSDPTKTDNTFKGWYTDSGFSTPFDDTEPITSNTNLYAKWQPDNAVAEVNGNYYTTLDDAIVAVPTGTTNKTRVIVLKDLTLTAAASIPSNKWVELDLQNYTLDTSTTDLIHNSGKLDIINGSLISTYSYTSTGDKGYVILNSSGATLNISGGLLRYNNTSASEGKVVKNNGGTINITGGRLECNAIAAAIDNDLHGTINMSGGEIVGTNSSKGQAIYNAGSSTVNISGNAYLENKSAASGGNARGAVDNNGGTITITGGTIVSKNYAAVGSRASGTTTIGIQDVGGNIIDTTTPILQGKQYAIAQANGTINVYDGVYMSGQSAAYTGTVVLPTGTAFENVGTETNDVGTLNVYYLAYTSGGPYTVTFDADNNTSSTQVSNITSLDTLGSSMPQNPTKTNYIFEKWFVYKEVNSAVYDAGEFTSSTPVVDNITVMAKWKPGIGTATISPASIEIDPNEKTTITVTGPDDMEAYTFASSDTSIATVDASGNVTGVAVGSTVITVTGTESGVVRIISVSVGGAAPSSCTVTFNTNGGPVIPSETVECGTSLGSKMPQNPTKNNHVFNGWIINGTNNSFSASTPVTSTITVNAQWIASLSLATISSSISVDAGSTTTISMTNIPTGMESYTVASSDTSIATVNNLVVTGVTVDSTTVTITGDTTGYVHTVTVNVTAPQCTVTFNTNGGSTISSETVDCGTSLGSKMPQNPTKNNHVFNGWIINGTNNSFSASIPVTSNITVDAQWIASLSLATISPNSISVEAGSTATIGITDIPTDMESYTIESSDTTIATVNNLAVTGVIAGSTTVTITGDTTGYVHTIPVTVTAPQCTVIFNTNGGAIIPSETIDCGSSLDVKMPSNPEKTNHIFDNWTIDGSGQSFDSTTTVSSNITVNANWTPGVALATVSPSSIILEVQETGTISITDVPTGMESYTIESSDTTIATVNGLVVTGTGLGETTITITGDRSGYVHTINVTVALVTTHDVTFDPDNGNTPTVVSVPIGDSLESYIPTDPTKTNYNFDDWYLYDTTNNTLTTTVIDPNEVITGDRTYKARWAASNRVCKIIDNGTVNYYTTLQYAINAAPQTKTTITMIADVNNVTTTYTTSSDNNKTKNLVIDLNNHTLQYTSTNKKPILEVYATIEVMNGTLTSTAESGTINVESGGHLIVNSGTISNTKNRQAIYNNGGTVEIGGTANLSAKTNGAYNGVGRGAITNVTGTLIVTGGTIINTDGSALVVNDGIVTIGTNDSTIDTTNPVFQGYSTSSTINAYGLERKTGTVNVYDGIFKGKNDGINTPASVNHPNGTEFDTDDSEIIDGNTYKIAYLVSDGTTPTPTPTATPTPEPTATATPEPTATATPEPLSTICKPVVSFASLHTEKCKSTSSTQGCRKSGYDDDEDITYGSIVTSDTYSVGNAFDCNVDGTGYNQRFYYLTTTDNKAVLISNTNFEGENGQQIGNNFTYDIALTKLPTISQWSTVATTYTHTGDSTVYAARFITLDEVETAAGTQNVTNNNALDTVQFLFENTSYALASGGRSTVWIEQVDSTTRYRYHKNNVNVVQLSSTDLNSSANCVRPVIEVPLSKIESVSGPTPTPTATPTPTPTPTATPVPTPVSHNVLGNAMQDYFSNVSTWVATDATDPSNEDPTVAPPQTKQAAIDYNNGAGYDNGHTLFKNSISSVFTTNSCSICQENNGTTANNSCDRQSSGTYCDEPVGYNTGHTGTINVYLYENGQKTNTLASYVTVENGVIYNMIPGVSYYWELASDASVYGIVNAQSGTRRTLKVNGVRNLRDLGGMSVSYTTSQGQSVTGTIAYGRLYRGAQITSADGVTGLEKLGVTREIDLRGTEGTQTWKMDNYDHGTKESYTDIEITNYLINPEATTFITSAHLNNYRAVKKALREVMLYVVNGNNSLGDNIFFHCTIGTDRTGTLAYFLEGLLGVSAEDRLRDYELTYFFGLTNRTRFHDSVTWSNTNPRFFAMYRSYPTNADIYNYYKYEDVRTNPATEMSDDDLLDAFRNAMIEHMVIS